LTIDPQFTEQTDLILSDYLHHLFDTGKSITTLRMALAAVNWWMTTTGHPASIGLATKATLKTLAESDAAQERGRGQANALTYEGAIQILTIAKPIDKAIVALLFMAGMRRPKWLRFVIGRPGQHLTNTSRPFQDQPSR